MSQTELRADRSAHHTSVFQHLDPPVTYTRLEIARIDLLRERASMLLINTLICLSAFDLLEHFRSFSEVMYIKHFLRIIQIPFLFELCI